MLVLSTPSPTVRAEFEPMTPEDINDAKQSLNRSDAQLNQTYKAAQGRLNEAGGTFLKGMQRSWVDFKAKDFALFTSVAAPVQAQERIYRYTGEEVDSQEEALRSLFGEGVKEDEREPDPRDPRDLREADQTLNSLYKDCLEILPAEKVQGFKEIQSLWIKFRDLYCQMDAAMKGGVASEATLKKITTRRIVQFRFYIQVLIASELAVEPKATTIFAQIYGSQDPEEERPEEKPDPAVPDIFRFAR